MTTPAPTKIRLLMRSPSAKPPKPPFGLRTWSPIGEAVGVFLDASPDDPQGVQGVAEQVPHASTLDAGTTVVVLGAARSASRFWRMLGGTVPISRATRCTALLVRGYVDIGAGTDAASGGDLVWGTAGDKARVRSGALTSKPIRE